MSTFAKEYASYYDLFYGDKDYVAESSFIGAIIKKYKPETHSILELGCGTARHAIELARAGFSVTGIDRNAEMIALGQNRVSQLSPTIRDRVALSQSDAINYESVKTFDAVVSLFHVVSYQTSNDALKGIFKTAQAALQTGGLFVFDFWYGPAVLAKRPEIRIRRINAPQAHLTRIAEPTWDSNRNVVDVKYTVIAIDAKTAHAKQTTEVHSMRYLFLPEIKMLATSGNFEVIEAGEWLTGKDLQENCWSAYAVLRLGSSGK